MLTLYLRSNLEKEFCNEARRSIKSAREHSAWPYIISISLLSAEYIIEHPHMSVSARQSLVDTVFNSDQKVKTTFLKSARV